MADDILDYRRGMPVYERNPSIPSAGNMPTRKRSSKLANGNRVMVVGAAGEVLGEGHAAFFEEVEVDAERFVKLFLDGVKRTADLTAAGMKVFGLVYAQMRDNPQTDRVEMNRYLGRKNGIELSERTYRRGLRELLDHEFLFCSPTPGLFFVNVNYLFNGDRIALAKVYRLADQRETAPSKRRKALPPA